METYEFGDKGLVKLGDLDEMIEEMVEGIKEHTKEFVIDSMCMHPQIEKEHASLEDELCADCDVDIDDTPQCETEEDFSILLMGHVGTIGSGPFWPDVQRIYKDAFFRIANAHKRRMPLKPPRHLTSGKHGYRIRKWVK